MNEPLISVIVPIYNVEQYINKCVKSICNQTYRNLEIILVDDGSPDNSGKICDEWAKRDSRVKVIHKKNGGLVSARKEGLLIASGKYAAYVDGDDWLEPICYETLIHRMGTDGDLVVTGFCSDDGNGTVVNHYNLIEEGTYSSDDLKQLRSKIINRPPFYTMSMYPSIWDKLFKREELLKFQMQVYDDISIGEDFVVSFPYILNNKKMVVTKDVLYHYRDNRQGMSKCRDKNYLKKCKPLIRFMKNQMYGVDSHVDKQLSAMTCHVLLNGLTIVFDLRTRLRFAEKCKMVKDVLNYSSVKCLLRDFEYSQIDFVHRNIAISALHGHYILCFLWVHIALMQYKWRQFRKR